MSVLDKLNWQLNGSIKMKPVNITGHFLFSVKISGNLFLLLTHIFPWNSVIITGKIYDRLFNGNFRKFPVKTRDIFNSVAMPKNDGLDLNSVMGRLTKLITLQEYLPH